MRPTMMSPKVTEQKRPLEPVERDPFIAALERPAPKLPPRR
jgi:hypothetical protein